MKRILLVIIAAFLSFSINAQILSEDFESTPGELPAGWLTVTPTYATAATSWHPTEYGGNNAFRASSYFDNTNHASEQWLVTPGFSLDGLTSVSFKFDNEKAAHPGFDMQVFISTDFPGDSASHATSTWDEIVDIQLSTGVYEWLTSTSDISAYAGNAGVYIAFKYTSTDMEGAVWDVDNIIVEETVGITKISNALRIFPNPASSVLNINSKVNISNIIITNVIGQRVFNINNIEAKNYAVEVEKLSDGVYIINIENTDGTSSITKFVKR